MLLAMLSSSSSLLLVVVITKADHVMHNEWPTLLNNSKRHITSRETLFASGPINTNTYTHTHVMFVGPNCKGNEFDNKTSEVIIVSII